MFINFSDIPGHQNLFLDYLYEFPNVEKFYKYNFREEESFAHNLSRHKNRSAEFSASISSIIRSQYGEEAISKKTDVNINLLASGKTVAIVTGQQLGIFGGPLYTFYKTITAVKLAAQLKEKYEEYNFVPVFWMEGDDHDFAEITSLKVFGKDNELKEFKYNDDEEPDFNRGSVGQLKLNQNIDTLIDDLFSEMRETEFSSEMKTKLKLAYYEDRKINSAFRKLMFELFDEFGLVIFNPQDHKVKEKLIPIFAKEINDFRKHTDEVLLRSAELEDLYHAQVKIRPVNLFYHEEGKRFSIEPDEENFKLKGKRKMFTKDELIEEVKSNPEKFSPNVLLRPICQDFLLPTSVYVGGPSEISYFAQVLPLYPHFDIPEPILYPRISATIVEKNLSSLLDKFELQFTDIFTEEKNLTEKIVNKSSEHNLTETFNKAGSEIELIISGLKEKLMGIDKTLLPLVEKTNGRILQSLDHLKTKAEKADERNYETDIRQMKRLRNNLYPESNLQEREINFIYFVNKYGMDLLKWVFSELTLNKYEHQVVEIE